MNNPSYPPVRIGIVGTGYISRGFTHFLLRQAHVEPSRVLTRRPLNGCPEFPRQDILTHSIYELIEHSDIIVECSGDPIHAAVVVDAAFNANLPVVTMNTEFQITCGSWFVNRGLLSEAEGDQPGSLAALAENVREMGFEPLVYGNVKGFQNLDPQPRDMQHWAEKQGISLTMVTASTDGTKLQAEQVLAGNGLSADIALTGMFGYPSSSLEEEAHRLADAADDYGQPITDYIIHPDEKRRVFIVARHYEEQQQALEYYKLGEGPLYILSQDKVLCHLEILKTVKRLIIERIPLLNNGYKPRLSLAAIAKRDIPAGTHITKAIGSFDFRGVAIRIADHPDHIPMGLMKNVTTNRNISKGELIQFDHVDIVPSLALTAWQETLNSI